LKVKRDHLLKRALTDAKTDLICILRERKSNLIVRLSDNNV